MDIRRVLPLLIAALLALTACTGSQEDQVDDLASELGIPTDDATAAADAAGEEVTAAIDAAGCEAAADALDGVAADVTALATGQGDMAALQSQLADFQQVVDAAPDDVAADMQVVATTLQDIGEDLAGVQVEAGTTPAPEDQQALSEAGAALTDTTFTAAADTVATWFAEGCPS